MIKYIRIFRLVLRCLLVARKENSTGFSTGLIGRLKNHDPTGRSTRPVSISDAIRVVVKTTSLLFLPRSRLLNRFHAPLWLNCLVFTTQKFFLEQLEYVIKDRATRVI